MSTEIVKNESQDLIHSKEFYFQKGKDALQKWLDIILSDTGQDELRNLLDNYSFFAELPKDHKFYSVKELFFEIISYCDLHARNKTIYNRYEDKRVLAKVGVRMKPWVINTFYYKYNPDKVNITVKNALDMLADPINNINSIAVSHRELISNYYLGHSYHSDSFVKELKTKFSDLETTQSPENQTLLIANQIYAEKKEWDRKAMNFKALVNNLKEYVQKNQLEYDFGKVGREHIWMFDKEHYFNHVSAHYEIIIEKKNISVDLHFEDEKSAEFMRSKLGLLPDFLKWKKWHYGNSVSHCNTFKLSDEDVVDNIITALDELFEATFEKLIDTVKELRINNMSYKNNTQVKYPLNQILYGPPGTGKTYNTINKAIQIVNPEFDLSLNRKEITKEYERLVENGQIVFTTFHQSMSYEDFIEGIKPDTIDRKDGGKDIIYDIKDGIFKLISEKAKDNWLSSQSKDSAKLSFEDAFSKLKDEWEENNEIEFPLTQENKEFTILGFTEKSIRFKKSSGGSSHTLSISTLSELYYNKKEIKKGGGLGIYYISVLNRLSTYSSNMTQKQGLQSFVLIIDEINRGNVSQIFGELITLLEEDKRIGNEETLEITLPYSKEKFSVPRNLYIIGTMNTADRSVEALDTALRRRFSFEEMPPKPELLLPSHMIENLLWKYEESGWNEEEYKSEESKLFQLLGTSDELWKQREKIWGNMTSDLKKRSLANGTYFRDYGYSGINLKDLLETINKRIEQLIDKDHAIGHAYFIGKNSWTMVESFYKNIIPLLQEYFFGDYGKIGLVLGKGFVRLKNESSVFAEFDYQHDYSEKECYEIIDYRNPDLNYMLEGSDVKMDFIKAIRLLMNQSV
ncbi:MAG: AAA family ATPase [Chryseobacterium sp.]|jgi:5-methylcytosine-specific restriction protein B|uniref:McrB family protein n=1 Tax=Chryseobacterium sp. TaxID=1871047 RepID=UPI002818A32E|nr:AAA family ATPase [Chryseobacterium sp.]MDR2235289.1 AAA family ATPase [Chryseobacterium sp.]